MTEQERSKILKMIQENKISPEEGLRLIQVLDESPEDGIEVVRPAEQAEAKAGPDPKLAARFDRVRRFWMVPLWIGILVTILGGWLMYWVLQQSGMNFWFFCSWVPFLVGFLLIIIAWGSRTSRWIHARIKRRPEQGWPGNISISLPLPLGLTRWVLRTFAFNLRDVERGMADEIFQVLEKSVNSDSPIYAEVRDEEDDDVEYVEVYIG